MLFSVQQYLEMAKECLREAERTADPARRKALMAAAKLYANSATTIVPDDPAALGEKDP